jgi:hypothetical protein
MQSALRVVVDHHDERLVNTADEADSLCSELAERPTFTASAYGGIGIDPSLNIIVETGRAHAFYMDLERDVKSCSRDERCTERGYVSLRNDAYPELELGQIELQRRSLILPERAIAIFRHYLKSGQPIDLVAWPAPDEDDWD